MSIKEKSKSTAKDKVRRILQISLSKKPVNPVVLDLKGVGIVWDYSLIMTSESKPQTQAILGELKKFSKKEGFAIHHIEEDQEKEWVLIDYIDVVVHVFSEDKRDLYRLDHIFKNAKKVRFRFREKT